MNKLKLSFFSCFVVVVLVWLFSCMRNSSSGISVNPVSTSVEKFEHLYIDIELNKKFKNPYDPEDIKVDAIIRPPDGDKIMLPCFYKDGLSGKSHWEARFTAMQTGTHSFHIQVTSKNDTSNSKEFYVSVKDSDKDGFLRINEKSLYSFVFDSGKRFRGVGINVGWELQTEWKHPYETYIEELAKNNANIFRTWMCTWNLPLEWTRMVMEYDGTITDEFENWDKVFSHSSGFKIIAGKTEFTEDDTNRIIIESDDKETIVYNLKDIRRFKIKVFYHRDLSRDKIKCYSSPDDITYSPVDIEFGQSWDTAENWKRMFIAYIDALPEGTNYLRIEFAKGLKDLVHLGNIQIECGKEKEVLDAPGLGRYYQETANRLDEILKLSEEKGVYIMLTFDYHGVFKDFVDRWASNAEWRTNPYNAANGGPCENQVDFFTNEDAKKIYKNKLRYIVARWGYSTNIACWEFFNEIDNVMEMVDLPPGDIVSWHREMADYLKKIDPYKHIVTTSVTYREVPALWDIENIEFSQHHNYGSTDNMKKSILNYVDRFKKPDVVGEFSLGWKGPDKDHPAELYEGEMHNGLWRGMFSPTPILPLPWWWEWHYHKGHYFHLRAASDFISPMLEDNEDVLEEISVVSVDGDMEVMGLKSGYDMFLWIRNPNQDEKKDLVLNIPETIYTSYLMRYYDTWTGEFSSDKEIELSNGQLILLDIYLESGEDMAVWIRPAR
jgi:hypothetical protein